MVPQVAPPTAPKTPPPSNAASLPASDSPPQLKGSTGNPNKATEFLRNERFLFYAAEMRSKFHGPVEPQEFLDTFLGSNAFQQGIPPSPWNNAVKRKFVKVPKDKEGSMYIPLQTAIQSCINSTFAYINTGSKLDVRKIPNCTDTSPDGILYDTARYAGSDLDSRFSDCFLEVKDKKNPDPFNDHGDSFESGNSQGAILNRGQVIVYAVAQFTNQYRTHLFSVSIRGKLARLLRWDHAGVVVTKAFRYDQKPHLADFFSRYSNATPEARGIDSTVLQADSNDANAIVAREKLKMKADEPVFAFKVWNDVEDGLNSEPEPMSRDDGQKEEDTSTTPEEQEIHKDAQNGPITYYGGKIVFSGTQSVTGRATRIIKVWDPRSNRVVMLKDCWRVDSEQIMPEGQVYALLKKNGVRNIPTCLRAGNVSPDSSMHRTHKPNGQPIRSHIHYRLIIKEVCRGNITDFLDTKELVSVLRDALIAHDDAYTKAKLLHRDVSAGNILITQDGRGLLGDWELSKPLSELGQPRQAERTGTWQFISAALLSTKFPCHKLEDDLESFFHVLSWTALQWTKHQLSYELLGMHLSDTYDTLIRHHDGPTTAGDGKLKAFRSHYLSIIGFLPGAFCDLLVDLEETYASRYQNDPNPDSVQKAERMLARFGTEEDRQEFTETHVDLRLLRNRARLTSSIWMIDRCTSALKSTDWSTESLQRVKNDFPKKNSIMVPETDRAAKKRRSQTSVAELEEDSRSTSSTSASTSRRTTRKKVRTSTRTAPSTMDSVDEEVEDA
ncbi:hypothetical protein VKT23_015065 [Stygiomarasmius scandens]|uniref:Fungal-type protein kinase domain-containing protein n=1 Tax=Marasmiellus scandens TaxID=2682957 RepID=A0ABR1IYG7_9AGAR